MELVQDVIELVLFELVASYGEDTKAGAIPAPLAMHNRVVVHETEARGGKSIELQDRNRLGDAAPGIFERLRRKCADAALDEGAFAGSVNAKPKHTRDTPLALHPLLQTVPAQAWSPTTELFGATFERTKKA
jgi:hypothetical protein